MDNMEVLGKGLNQINNNNPNIFLNCVLQDKLNSLMDFLIIHLCCH